MSLSSVSRQKKLREAAHSEIIKVMKLQVDNGAELVDLDFSQFGKERDEMFKFMKKYIKIKKGLGGIDLF